MKKKIAFVTKALWIGGIETALINLLNYINYEKYEVSLIVLHAELNMFDKVNPLCRVIIIDRENTYAFDKSYKYSKIFHLCENGDNPSFIHRAMMWTVPMIRWIENNLFIHYVRDLMKSEVFDSCIIYSDVVSEIAIKAIKAKKYLMFYHHGVMRHVYHDKIAYTKCDKIIAVSKNQAKALKKFNPKSADKIIAIHNLVNIEGVMGKADQSIPEYFDKSKYNIVSVGRVSHEKGMDIAVRVCAKLVQAGFEDIVWWIVGDGPAMDEVMNTITEMNMKDHVRTVGMKENPYPYIKKADLYVQPSRFEGYPMTILEALILGQPVISTSNNGAKEILTDGENGVLRKIDESELAEAIIYLVLHPEELSKLKENVFKMDFKEKNKQQIKLLEELL